MKNTSRQIGGWISTSFTEPQRYFLRLYRINVNLEKAALELVSDLDVPSGQIHGELLSHQIYEAEDGGVFLMAKDGYRIRDTNMLQGEEKNGISDTSLL